LYGKTKSRKHGPASVLIVEENQVVVAWVFPIQEVGLSISLQQLKMKVAYLTQTRPTPFQGGVLGSSWWYWFKRRHPEFNIHQVEGLDIN
jgi:hypothetical protein